MVDAELADARRAHLRWVTDTAPGISRRRRGSAFSYLKNGALIRDPETLARIRALAVPPAWTDVWICPTPNGHIQATGRDARKRKQYRYHARWREIRDSNKYDRTDRVCRSVAAHSRAGGFGSPPSRPGPQSRARGRRPAPRPDAHQGRQRGIREGQQVVRADDDALEPCRIEGDAIRLSFRGKGGKRVVAEAHDRRVATVMQRCTALPGEELFQYDDADGEPAP